MRSPRLLLRAVLATVLVTASAVVGLVTAGGVGAMEQPTVVVPWDKETFATFGPLIGQNPVLPTAVQDPVPDDCRLIPVPGVNYCDVVPVKVVLPPDFDDNRTYAYTVVSLVWEADPVGAGANDLDMYIYNADDEQVSSSASSANPEQAKTESREFWVVVNNFSGAVTEYSLRFKVFQDTIEKPFELLEPEAPSGGFGLPTGSPFIDGGPGAGGFGLPMDNPSLVDGTDTGAAGSDTPSGALGKIELVPAPDRTVDIDFDAIQREVEAAEAAAADTPADAGPGAGVWFWLVLLPIALVAGSGAWLVKRRPASLKR